jgi:hypothetical protein
LVEYTQEEEKRTLNGRRGKEERRRGRGEKRERGPKRGTRTS